MSKVSYFRKQFVPVEEAVIPIQNHAFMYGTSLFEGIRGYWVPEQNAISIFRAQEHFERLIQNSRIFHMDPGHTLDEMMHITTELIRQNAPTEDTYIRPTLFKDGQSIGATLSKTGDSLCMFSAPLGAYVDIEKGLSVCVSNWRRLGDNTISPRAKAGGAYMNTAVIVADAHKAGFDDAIVLTQEGHVSEGSAMNFFMVRHGKLVTPPVTDDILEGVTRNTLIELAQNELGIETVERSIDRTELYIADEAFYCGTGAQVAPITRIDNRPVGGQGEIGPISKQIQALYFDVVKNRVPKYSHWCTMVPIPVLV